MRGEHLIRGRVDIHAREIDVRRVPQHQLQKSFDCEMQLSVDDALVQTLTSRT